MLCVCEDPSWAGTESRRSMDCGCVGAFSLRCSSTPFSPPSKAGFAEGWFADASHNQAMRFGDLPEWGKQLSCSIQKAVLSADCLSELDTPEHKQGCSFPISPTELLGRDPLFDQLIVIYTIQGICAHIDLMRFEDGTAIVSLESPCIMHFSPLEDYVSTTGNPSEKPKTAVRKIPVYLAPGSLVVMSGEARYLWKHEINRKPGIQMWEGREINQERRVSITLRMLCKE